MTKSKTKELKRYDWTLILLIIFGILLFGLLFYFCYAIMDSHSICNSMNLTGCGK